MDSVVEERNAVRNRVDVFHQPVVKFPAHTRRELANETQGHCAREYGIIQEDELEVTQPLYATKLA